jgi:hypothetical protein
VTALDLTWPMRRVDAILRRRMGVAEFSGDPECLIRVSRIEAGRALTLAGGAVRPGDAVLEIHLWNEHLPPIPADGRTASWANLFKRRMRFSLALLARHVAQHPECRHIVAITASPAFPDRIGPLPLARLCEHFGWEIVPPRHASDGIHARLDGLLVWLLIWAFNPAGLRDRGVAHRRIEVWMSRARLLERYGAS